MKSDNESKNVFSNLTGSQTHWFLSRHQAETLTQKPEIYHHRLNELDTNILENGKEIDTQTQSLKLEYLIKDREGQMAEINQKIQNAEHAGDQQELFTHRAKKQRLETELRDLRRKYATRDLNSKYPPKNSSAQTLKFFGKLKRFVQRYVLAKISKKINSLVQLSDSLEALQDINSNVDDLIKIKTPYGESVKNYEQLTEYLSKANKIHSQISKTMKR